jgi:hypothetical protein
MHNLINMQCSISTVYIYKRLVLSNGSVTCTSFLSVTNSDENDLNFSRSDKPVRCMEFFILIVIPLVWPDCENRKWWETSQTSWCRTQKARGNMGAVHQRVRVSDRSSDGPQTCKSLLTQNAVWENNWNWNKSRFFSHLIYVYKLMHLKVRINLVQWRSWVGWLLFYFRWSIVTHAKTS